MTPDAGLRMPQLPLGKEINISMGHVQLDIVKKSLFKKVFSLDRHSKPVIAFKPIVKWYGFQLSRGALVGPVQPFAGVGAVCAKLKYHLVRGWFS